ncbi:MAG: hypothetical protein R3224_02595 [Balneolaceae bacterium]|nr:hypothetical protein [Balneolaceae bacterium]
MFLLQSDELIEHTSDIIHKETQQHKLNLDLTASEIFRLTGPGALDFGGSEFEPAQFERIEPAKKNPDDEYGWWNLNTGTYKVRFNEHLKNLDDTLIAIAAHPHARKAGIIADTCLLNPEDNLETIEMNFRVPHTGTSIKENARFATLYILAG